MLREPASSLRSPNGRSLKLARLARTRLAEESAKLDPAEERRLADEGLAAAGDAWPE
jgi:hypothetical protein